MLENHVFWRLILFYTHLLLLLQPSVLWLSIVTFNNNAKPQPKWILREFDVLRTPPWKVYMAKSDPSWEGYPVWQTGLPALAGHPIYHVHVIKLKWEIIDKTTQDKTRQGFIWSLIQSYVNVYRLDPNNLKSWHKLHTSGTIINVNLNN